MAILITLDARSGVPIYRQIRDQIRHHILTRHIPSGTQIPSVRDLSAELKVNPMTVSKAFAMLEQEGLVEKRRGLGLFAVDLSDKARDQSSSGILDDILKNAALTAVQLGLSKDKATQLFREFYDRYKRGGE